MNPNDDDSSLLREYTAGRSERAFSRLVERHIHLVYAAARRQVGGDAHLAEDITQAVFIVLARRAGSVRCGAVLPAWLLTTTRHTAANLLTSAARRRHHERMAADMAAATPSQSSPLDECCAAEDSITAHLDEAMARLGEKDRGVVAMRFLQGKSLREVGLMMGVSEEAAQKRVCRAVEKMRGFFARRGLAMEPSSLSSGLARQAAQLAPAALAPVVAAAAWSAAGSAGAAAGGAGAIAQTVMKAMAWGHAKLAAGVVVGVVVVAGAGAVAIQARRPPAPQATPIPFNAPAPPPAPATTAPAALSSDAMWEPYVPSNAPPISVSTFKNIALMPLGGNTSDFDNGIDANVRRTKDSDPAAMIKCLIPNPTPQTQGMKGFTLPLIGNYRGKRIRLTGYLKTQDVDTAAGLLMIVWGPGRAVYANDDMGGRAVLGTTDWKQYAIVADVPTDAEGVDFGVKLRGKGTVWVDQLEIAVVGNDVPTTDDSRWHPWSFTPGKYSATLDRLQPRNGRPTICLQSTAPVISGGRTGDWFAYDRNDRRIEDLRGKRVRMSAMIKCEGVVAGSGPSLRAHGSGFVVLARDNTFGKRPVRGTLGWAKYTVELLIPPDAQYLCSGFILNGRGKMWVDEVTYELLDK